MSHTIFKYLKNSLNHISPFCHFKQIPPSTNNADILMRRILPAFNFVTSCASSIRDQLLFARQVQLVLCGEDSLVVQRQRVAEEVGNDPAQLFTHRVNNWGMQDKGLGIDPAFKWAVGS